jgi:hypothetical protein
MVVNPREIAVDRDMVVGWLREWLNQPTIKDSLDTYLRTKVDASGPHPDINQVVTGEVQPTTISLADLIIQDLPSYLPL